MAVVALRRHQPTTTEPTMTESPSINIALFASGQGSNARQIIRLFHEEGRQVLGKPVRISLVLCNKPGAGVLEIAEKAGIPALILDREIFFRGSHYLPGLREKNISFLVLAGFLWKIPLGLIRAFPDRIINIHPALLPAYGGKGMYGRAVHEAVVAAGEKESGITIHLVDEQYDHGQIFFQARCVVSRDDSPDSLAAKIHDLEHAHYPQQIARWIETKLSLNR